MSIFLGANSIIDIKIGSQSVSKIYHGATEVWPTTTTTTTTEDPNLTSTTTTTTTTTTTVSPMASKLLLHLDSDFSDSSPDNLTTTAGYYGGSTPYIDTTEYFYGGGSAKMTGQSYIHAGDSELFDFETSDFTVEAWIKFNNFNDVAIFGPDVNTCGGFFVIVGGSVFRVGRQCEGWILESTHSMSTGTWYHIAICRAAGDLRVFIDGVAIATLYSNATSFSSASTLSCVGGAYYASNSLDGWIDEVRVFKGFGYYAGDFTVPSPPLSFSSYGSDNAPTLPLASIVSGPCPLAPYGTFLFNEYIDDNLIGTYADGNGGRFTDTILTGSF